MTPKTLKFYLKGNVVTETISYQTESGEILTYEQVAKLVVPSKKNQQRAISNKATGRAYLIPSQQYINWRKETMPEFEKFYLQAYDDKEVSLPIVRCNINCIFYYGDAKSRDNHNKFETIADMLVEAGILADDSFKVINELKMRGYVCKEKPRTEIYITIVTPDMQGYEWDITSGKYKDMLRKKKTIQKRISRAKQAARMQPEQGLQAD